VVLDGSTILQAHFIIRHFDAEDLIAEFRVRTEYPFWTSRKIINGSINLTNDLIGDVPLEETIEGVMYDIKTVLAAEDIDYSSWTGLSNVPFQIMRATTYGVCASLYARSTKTFSSRVIPSISPVTVTVIGDAERAMNFWENRMERTLERYYASIGHPVITVSTADEEPVFSMADIPTEIGDDGQWRRDFGVEVA